MSANIFRHTLAVAAALAAGAPAAQAANVAPGAARVASALAFVANPGRKGTAFAVASSAGRTVFLTAAHVVDCASIAACAPFTVILHGDLHAPRTGHVIALGNSDRGNDLAAFTVDEGPLPTVTLGGKLGAGQAAAVLGYPAATTAAALADQTLEASATAVLAMGTVRVDDGIELEGSFETFPGDSGGPVFDPASGNVSGIVHGQAPNDGAYLATGSAAIGRFLQQVALVAGPRATPTLASAPAMPQPSDANGAYATALKLRASDTGEYVRNLRIAADAGNGLAAEDLAQAYRTGTGVAKDRGLGETWMRRAVALLQAAAAHDDGAALLRLAAIAERSELLPENDPARYAPENSDKAALDFTLRAARAGSAEAMYNLGRDYDSGYLVNADRAQSLHWLCSAAIHGSADSANWLAYLYSSSTHVPQLQNADYSNRWYAVARDVHAPASIQSARAMCRAAGVTL